MKSIKKVLLLSNCVVAFVASAATSLPDFASLIKENAPAVVQIDAKSTSSVRRHQGAAPDDLLRYFFGTPNGQPSIPKQQPASSHGSGFFIDADGYVITNAHVVNGADEITVSTTNQSEYKATLIGLDKRTDIALLKVDKTGLPSVKIGDSDKIEVGNWVLAIGSPFGFDYTATKGIISAVSRSLPDGTYVPFIQTDAAVNPGNSGGPLFNLAGEVIGVNSQIYSSTGSFNGLAFSIPINVAMNIANQLKDQGYVSRGWLGVAIQNIDQTLANSFGLKEPKGALISSVIPNSPAEKAGIQAGDVILSFNGKEIIKSSELPPIVGSIRAGEEVPVLLVRNEKEEKIIVKVGELEEGNKNKGLAKTKSNQDGLVLAELTSEKKKELKLKNGIIVEEIIEGSLAEDSGFERNDVIIAVNNNVVDSMADFSEIMSKLKDNRPVAVLVNRQGATLFIPF